MKLFEDYHKIISKSEFNKQLKADLTKIAGSEHRVTHQVLEHTDNIYSRLLQPNSRSGGRKISRYTKGYLEQVTYVRVDVDTMMYENKVGLAQDQVFLSAKFQEKDDTSNITCCVVM